MTSQNNYITAWTDYPFIELGDKEYEEAPVRQCIVTSYDGDKYCKIKVEGTTTEIKSGYLYKQPGRYGEVKAFRHKDLEHLEK